MDKKSFKSKPYHVKQKHSGEIDKTIHSSDTDIGTSTVSADLHVYGDTTAVSGTFTGDVTATQLTLASPLPVASGGTGVTTSAELVGLVSTIGTYASRPNSNLVTGQRYTATDGTEWVYDGSLSLWRPLIQGVVGLQPPLASEFAWVNQVSCTATDNVGQIFLTCPGSATVEIHCFMKSSAGTKAEIGGIHQPSALQTATATQRSQYAGAAMRETATGKMLFFSTAFSNDTANPWSAFWFSRWTSNTVLGANSAYYCAPVGSGPLFLRLRNDGTTIYGEYTRGSPSNSTWQTIASVAKTTAFTTAPNQSGICIGAEQGTGHTAGYLLQHYDQT